MGSLPPERVGPASAKRNEPVLHQARGYSNARREQILRAA